MLVFEIDQLAAAIDRITAILQYTNNGWMPFMILKPKFRARAFISDPKKRSVNG